jgi:4-aminobutyrate aminotransferase-like enzyme
MVMKKDKSLELWKERGHNVLMVMPYDDILISGAEGCYLYDADGNRYIDMACGQLCAGLGQASR